MTDKCPRCGGYADNGHDREYPPNVYLCSKCENPMTERDEALEKIILNELKTWYGQLADEEFAKKLALEIAAPQSPVPEGYVLVPREPDADMYKAMVYWNITKVQYNAIIEAAQKGGGDE